MEMNRARDLRVTRLFHYQRFNAEYLIPLLARGVLRFSNPSTFNDPWDCRPRFGKQALMNREVYERHVHYMAQIARKLDPNIPAAELARRSEILRRDPALMERLIDENTVKIAEAIRQHYRIYCLSRKADSPLMWSHYAESHRGVCLEFDADNDFFGGALAINYQTSYPEVDMTSDEEPALVVAALLTKSSIWSYEEEFRLVSREGQSEGFLVTNDGFLGIQRQFLKAVIVGAQMKGWERDTVRWLIQQAGNPRIEMKHALMVPGRYELSIEPL